MYVYFQTVMMKWTVLAVTLVLIALVFRVVPILGKDLKQVRLLAFYTQSKQQG